MNGIETELARIVKPFDASEIWGALAGASTVYSRDAVWRANSKGHPRTVPRGQAAFDGNAFLAGVQALSFLATNLTAGDSRRLALVSFDQLIATRLDHPELLLYGCYDGPRFAPHFRQDNAKPYVPAGTEGAPDLDSIDDDFDNKALVLAGNYLYFRPAFLNLPSDWAIGDRASQPNDAYAASSLFSVLRVFQSAAFRRLVISCENPTLKPEAYAIDPRASSPKLVAEAAATLEISPESATYYLQLLALCDASDKFIREANDWKPATLKNAAKELEARGLVEIGKKPRGNRAATLRGLWESAKSPDPAIEHSKLSLYSARVIQGELDSPLDRVLPLAPMTELFQTAWVAFRERPVEKRPDATKNSETLLDAVAKAPDDDATRLVYADALTEAGDPLGELVTLQVHRLELARHGDSSKLDAITEAEAILLTENESRWIEPIYSFVNSVRWDRGCIVGITIHGKAFAKHAELLFRTLPLLREITLVSARRNHIDAFVGTPEFARITQLDFTPEIYLSDTGDLKALLGGKYFPRLEWLRIGFHRTGQGFGRNGASMLATCERLSELRFLEVAGQNLGFAGIKHLVEAEVLSKLEVLRLPCNNLKTPGARKFIKLIEQGALPTLRVFDVGNVIDTNFVTKAVRYYRNRVAEDVGAAIIRALGARAK